MHWPTNLCISCPFRVPSSQALLSCSEHARFCCPFWLLSSSQSTMAPTCVPAATRSTTMARRATYTARRADPARARSLYWRTAAYNPTDEGGRARTLNPLTITTPTCPGAHEQCTFLQKMTPPPSLVALQLGGRMSCGNCRTYYKCVTGPTGSWPWPWGTGSGAKDILAWGKCKQTVVCWYGLGEGFPHFYCYFFVWFFFLSFRVSIV